MEFSWPEITSGTKQSLSVAVFRQAAFWSGGGILHYRTMSSFFRENNLIFLFPLNFVFVCTFLILSFLHFFNLPVPNTIPGPLYAVEVATLLMSLSRMSGTYQDFDAPLRAAILTGTCYRKCFSSALPASASFYFIVILNIFSLI